MAIALKEWGTVPQSVLHVVTPYPTCDFDLMAVCLWARIVLHTAIRKSNAYMLTETPTTALPKKMSKRRRTNPITIFDKNEEITTK